jgi:hypothetical protein
MEDKDFGIFWVEEATVDEDRAIAGKAIGYWKSL